MSLARSIISKLNLTPVELPKKHEARSPGVSRTPHGWTAFRNVRVGGRSKVVRIGDSYKSFCRAMIAQKLYVHWLNAGYSPEDIPTIISKKFHQRGRKRT